MDKLQLHIVRTDEKHHIEKIVLPNKDVEKFNEEEGFINFEVLRPYIGQDFVFMENGEETTLAVLDSIDEYVDGKRAIIYSEKDQVVHANGKE